VRLDALPRVPVTETRGIELWLVRLFEGRLSLGISSNPDGDANASTVEIATGHGGEATGGQRGQEDQKNSGHGKRKVPENVHSASGRTNPPRNVLRYSGIAAKKGGAGVADYGW
jgi:hypothetical protein